MLWNADTMPPYALPANATMQGIKTNKSKGGGGFNELVMEDKKDKEFVRFQSERDYQQIVKNNAMISIGADHKDSGDLTQFVHRDATEIVGAVRTHLVGYIEDISVGGLIDETVGAAKTQTVGIYKEEKIGVGKQDITTPAGLFGTAVTLGGPFSSLYKGGKYARVGAAATALNAAINAFKQPGKKEEIHGTSHLEVFGDRKIEVSKATGASKKPGDYSTMINDGDHKFQLKKGDHSFKVDKGKSTTTIQKDAKTQVKMGNYSVKADKGKVTIQAMQSIELKVGSNKIKIDMSGVTIDATMIKLKAKAMANVEGAMVTVKGKGMTKIEARW